MARSLKESRALQKRAEQLIPGGVNSPVRAFRSVGSDPPFLVRGLGAYVWDADGNRYIDYVGSWGPLILGHSDPVVIEAIVEAARNGTSFGASTPSEADLAALVIEAFPAIEKVRFVSSGTEATMSAIRLARAATEREFHRQVCRLLPRPRDEPAGEGGLGVATLGIPGFARRSGRVWGVDHRVCPTTIRRGRSGFRRASKARSRRDRRAGGRQHGLRSAAPGFLTALREITARSRRAADLRRGDDRLSRGLRRGVRAVLASARSDDAGQNRRRRPAGGRVRRSGEHHGQVCPRGRCFRPAR